ncbi:hypothetical protein [Treponema denticola]|uniref:hypothetical protein n=1 Tax=Treponema denticola TaxID=158 RepID=UPI0020A415DD|nr:hypothetical protein [Treponema denticola]UTC93182.1 hypothetical protein E4N84_08770 [Treponema denticola]
MADNEFLKEIEINGIKVEVDLRTAKKIDVFRIGDNIKILKKDYNEYKTYSGVVIDFVAFKERPAIVVAYFKNDYNGVDICFETITKESQDIEIAPCLPHEMTINKDRVIDKFNYRIDAKQHEVDELVAKRDYFIKNFSRFFEEAETEKN